MRRYTDLGVLLDDNNRRPICRLWLNGSRKYLELFDNEQRKETKIPIEGLDDLYGYADREGDGGHVFEVSKDWKPGLCRLMVDMRGDCQECLLGEGKKRLALCATT